MCLSSWRDKKLFSKMPSTSLITMEIDPMTDSGSYRHPSNNRQRQQSLRIDASRRSRRQQLLSTFAVGSSNSVAVMMIVVNCVVFMMMVPFVSSTSFNSGNEPKPSPFAYAGAGSTAAPSTTPSTTSARTNKDSPLSSER